MRSTACTKIVSEKSSASTRPLTVSVFLDRILKLHISSRFKHTSLPGQPPSGQLWNLPLTLSFFKPTASWHRFWLQRKRSSKCIGPSRDRHAERAPPHFSSCFSCGRSFKKSFNNSRAANSNFKQVRVSSKHSSANFKQATIKIMVYTASRSALGAPRVLPQQIFATSRMAFSTFPSATSTEDAWVSIEHAVHSVASKSKSKLVDLLTG